MIPFDFVALQMRPERVLGQLARVGHHAVGALAREQRLLHGELLVGALVQAAADLRVLALVVLADDHHVDLLGGDVLERGGDAGPQPDRPQVHVLAERAADRDQQAPEADVVGHVVPADGAEEDRVGLADGLERVRRHHPAVLDEVVAAPRVLGELELEAVGAPGRLEHLERGRRDLEPDPVARDHGDLVRPHASQSGAQGGLPVRTSFGSRADLLAVLVGQREVEDVEVLLPALVATRPSGSGSRPAGRAASAGPPGRRSCRTARRSCGSVSSSGTLPWASGE